MILEVLLCLSFAVNLFLIILVRRHTLVKYEEFEELEKLAAIARRFEVCNRWFSEFDDVLSPLWDCGFGVYRLDVRQAREETRRRFAAKRPKLDDKGHERFLAGYTAGMRDKQLNGVITISKELWDDFCLAILHGDESHRQWLIDEFAKRWKAMEVSNGPVEKVQNLDS